MQLAEPSPLVRVATARAFNQAPASIRVVHLAPLLSDSNKAVRIAAARGFISLPAKSISPNDRMSLRSALQEFQSSLISNADHPNTQMALAGLALSFKNVNAAKAATSAALSLDPQLTDAWIMRAKIDIALQRPDLVEKTLAQAKSKIPNSPIIFRFSANYLASQRQYKNALRDIEMATSLSANDWATRLDHAAILGQSGNHEKALELLDNLLSKNNNDLDALYMKAVAQIGLNKEIDARATVLRLLTQNPAYPISEGMKKLFTSK